MLSRIVLLPVLLPFYLLGVAIHIVVCLFDWLFTHIGWAFRLGIYG